VSSEKKKKPNNGNEIGMLPLLRIGGSILPPFGTKGSRETWPWIEEK
jgi:hypothetical protein